MKIIETDLPGCLIVEPQVFGDSRGYFYESFNRDKLAKAGLDLSFAQGNVSSSARGVLRGLHYQWPKPQGKFVSVIEGEVWDVAVDIRRGSPHFGRWTAAVLSGENKRHFWIPEGFAHGFAVLSEKAVFTYLCTQTYDAQADAGLRWDDPDLAIDWPISEPTLSAKDQATPLLKDVAAERLPDYAA
ncbi:MULTISPECIES: dTDP-4-dehydrorhamnose 3,5-epimerase [Lysobacter]|jgi:dTDP-4-dehydrorhamnose 3,5-epimerase|uniref:dTDP-4-dehydrorhamnose 3,5-epimerase n=1 Tax=Lysobacter gummosus TaxID=262324 RepID=A0ABY3X6H4_9GAMM|nr:MULTISPECIES: dTDP-4-dehydrorhamnose 3,5-epimerase [Lysobacter]ALN92597.1 dTDP-4-dehydrorhamnose 3,5-epimerase [Lysobacter gummosus]UJB20563.1 dTDP-4-dehydrorhamnose 3,5-epimerase [Lysobacter capsici]UJQ30323.1 dTDP-4-dehydrorhamnose 3,5-epimerase [Lysobacter gummosus]UNP28168.1 dTDP-4-dehydrorhamnose 3,5-epimerase [Lysobacter gummosus]